LSSSVTRVRTGGREKKDADCHARTQELAGGFKNQEDATRKRGGGEEEEGFLLPLSVPPGSPGCVTN